ncbi:hypothetical protein GT037_011051 [Alternaria burnsii]|uniref:Uncharacterized protein n=1 Tax=Alternaria burnsii TaxID=1187904 RepID=A0A8H7AUT2_9PLEO|nr:uncharacterized protein GT037_011051 [Alternaria burnsii]KAF7670923.1 hypothetical protein GT037_011051 [Alternaria burnsii]
MATPVSSWEERLRLSLKSGLIDQRADVSKAGSFQTLAQGDGESIGTSPDAYSIDIHTYVVSHAILGEFSEEERNTHGARQIIDRTKSSLLTLVRGTPKASLLHHISQNLDLDPESVLEYYGFLDTFRIRSLPSRTPPVATIRFISLGMFSPAPFMEGGAAQLRSELNAQLRDHYEECLNDDHPGSERCRRINVHDTRFFTVEQQATLLTHEESTGSWSGVWFTDFGSKSSLKPWIPKSIAGIEAQFYPVVPRGQCSMSSTDAQPSKTLQTNTTPNVFLQEGTDKNAMSEEDCQLCVKDPFMFLSDIYDTSALSWMQVFSYLRASLELLPEEPVDQGSQLRAQGAQLRADKDFLDHAICYFSEVTSFLKHPPKTWQQSTRSKDVATRLITDFEVLRHEAEDLSRRCSESISIAMSTISILDSQKSLDEARRVQFITFLAFIFIPMTFIASCFGMNIVELADPGSDLRTYFTIAVPFTVVMLMVPIWIEYREWMRTKVRVWHSRSRGR